VSWDAISNALSSVDTAIRVIKAIKAADGAIEKAELKFKLAEMMEALADAKEALSESRDARQALFDEIARLKDALAKHGMIVRQLDAYYDATEEGEAKGDPYCTRCWEIEHRLVHLIRGDRTDAFHHCAVCRQKYSRRASPFSIERRGLE
jgi:chromosome segregation ATPase